MKNDHSKADIKRRLAKVDIFNEKHLQTSESSIFNTKSSLYLLDHYYFPEIINETVSFYYPKTQLREEKLLAFFADFCNELRKLTWRAYRISQKKWEVRYNITKAMKLSKNSNRNDVTRLTAENHIHQPPPVLRFLPEESYLLWITSNFLHGGAWKLHCFSHLLNSSFNNNSFPVEPVILS
jgi:hypothetical protein